MSESTETDGKRITARFHPQAWVNDCAIAVDPEGPVEFDVTSDILELGRDRALTLEDDRYETDHLVESINAPAWIRNWSGPYWVEVEDSIKVYYGVQG